MPIFDAYKSLTSFAKEAIRQDSSKIDTLEKLLLDNFKECIRLQEMYITAKFNYQDQRLPCSSTKAHQPDALNESVIASADLNLV